MNWAEKLKKSSILKTDVKKNITLTPRSFDHKHDHFQGDSFTGKVR